MFRMPQNLKQAWINDLRSGQYKQGFGHLHKNGCHCVLGLLDNLTNNGLSEHQDDEMRDMFTTWREKYGIYSDDYSWNLQLNYFGINRYITILNDIHKLSFNTLADLIEEQVIGY